jgi:LCP family protein required for cell wall assembly
MPAVGDDDYPQRTTRLPSGRNPYDQRSPRGYDPYGEQPQRYDQYGQPVRSGRGYDQYQEPPRGDDQYNQLYPEQPKPKRRRRRGRIVAIVAGSLVLLLILATAGLWLYADHSLHRVNAIADYSGRPAAGDGTNWLIVGSDSRQGLSDAQANKLHTGTGAEVSGSRTDTIMILHLPSNGTKPTLVSLLRDSLVSIPGHGKTKINAAFTYGGPQLLVRTVEQNTGLRIEHYAEIGLGGFANVVDDVGGVRMCLPQADNDAYAGINLKAGCQTLNGVNALGYARSRHAFAASDYARTDHQREFIHALSSKALSPGTLLNPFRSIPMILDVPKALSINKKDGLWGLLSMAWHARSMTSTAVPIGGSDGSDLVWDPTKSQELFHDLNHDQPVPSSLITTE